MAHPLHKTISRVIYTGGSVTLYTTGGHKFTGYPAELMALSVRLGANGPNSAPFEVVDLTAVVAVRHI